MQLRAIIDAADDGQESAETALAASFSAGSAERKWLNARPKAMRLILDEVTTTRERQL